MNNASGEDQNKILWLPISLAVVAFVNAYLYSTYQDPNIKKYCPMLFGTCLGLALILWGTSELRAGKIKGKRAYVYREKSPLIFNLLLFGKRFIPGIIMLLAGIWYGFFKSGT